MTDAPHGPAAPPSSTPFGSRALLLLALAATLVASWSSTGGEFVYDDLLVIKANPRLPDLQHWWRAFGATYWEFLEPEVADHIGYWRPLATLAHTLTYALAQLSPWGYHLVSIALHLGTVALAFRLTLSLTPQPIAAFCAALVFGLHPLNVESWAWISAQNGLLAGFFGLASLCLWVRWRDRGSRGLPLGATLCFWLALLSKEIAVALLPIAVCLDIARRRSVSPAVAGTLRGYLFFGSALLQYYFARVLVFDELGAGLGRTVNDFGPDVGFVRLIRLRVELLGGGLRRLLVPETTLFRVFRPTLPVTDTGYLLDLVALLGWTVATAVAWLKGKRRVAAVLLLAPVAILPTCLRVGSLGLFPVSDRFYYLASAGYAVALCALAFRWLPSKLAAPALIALAAYFGLQSNARADTWSNEDKLFRTALAESPDSPYVYWGLGRVLLNDYRETGNTESLREAHETFNRSGDLLERALTGDGSLLATRNDLLQTNLGIGWCHLFEAELDPVHDYATPRAVFEAVVELQPGSCEAHTGLGVALAAEGKTTEADRAFRRAIELNDRYAPAHHNLALLLARQAEWPRAQKHVEAALAQRVDHREDLVLLARIAFERGFKKRAREVADRAHALYPDDPEALVVLATIAGASGDSSGALARLDEALRLDPTFAPALAEKGRELGRQGEFNAAMETFRAACELLPGDFEVHYNLGAMLLQSGATDAAAPYLTRAYSLAGAGDERSLRALRETLPGVEAESLSPLALGIIDARRGHAEPALRWMNLAIERGPVTASAHLHRSKVHKQLGSLELALADVVAAEEIEPATFLTTFRRAELLDELGREAEACSAWSSAAELDSPQELPPELNAAMRKDIAARLRDC